MLSSYLVYHGYNFINTFQNINLLILVYLLIFEYYTIRSISLIFCNKINIF